MYRKILTRTINSLRMVPVRYRQKKPLCPYPPDYSKVDKVTICGALNPLGMNLAFVLKNTDIIREIALFDDCNVRGLAMDLEHMNTKTKVRPYSGDYSLKDALRNSDIVIITNGFDSGFETTGDVLCRNARTMYNYGMKIASVCPDALVCIVTPPLNVMVQIFSEAMKACSAYDPNKVFGVPSLVEMRARSIVGDYLCIDPSSIKIPIIGGVTPQTVVPMLSRATPYNEFTPSEMIKLINDILEVPEQCKKLHTVAPLSTAYAVSQFVYTLAAGLCTCDCAIQTAFVRSNVLHELKYFASSLKIGLNGVEQNFGIPKLHDIELNLLSQVIVTLQEDAHKACELFEDIHGHAKREETEELRKPRKPFFIKTPCPPCPPCIPRDICPEKTVNPCAPSEDKAWGF